jgi:cytochrome c-type biogenesis protein CcmH/NrfG
MTEADTPAVDKAQSEIAADPNNVDGFCNLGWGFYGARQYADAIQAFNDALKLDAGSVDALYGLGLSLKESGAGEDAVPVFARVMKLAPQKEQGARGRMLARLSRGHINLIRKGEWDLDEDVRYEAGTDEVGIPTS